MREVDLGQLMRFGTTGFMVATVYVVLHALLVSQVSAVVSNLIAFGSAVAVQFVLQTVWTFKRDLKDRDQAMRFGFVIAVGLAYSSFVTAIAGPSMGLSAPLSAGLVAVTLPVLNYIAFRLWVYT